MHVCFVSTHRGSHFMTELLAALSAATATTTRHQVELAFDKFPPLRKECVYVVIPHEFRAWGDPDGFPDARQRARTIALCTENPGTPWFEQTYELVPQFAAAVSINRSSASELQRRGIRCEHLQLGYSPLWDSWKRDESAGRPIEVLYLGAADPRRDPLLAGLSRDLSARQCQFLVPPLEPRTRPRPDFLKGAEKYQRLRSAQILLNMHRTSSSALEWMRFLEAICNGCVMVSEPCLDGDPLIAGEHYIEVPVEDIAVAINGLLDDPDQLQRMRQRAYDFVREELPMETAAKRLVELAGELPREPPAAASASPSLPDGPTSSAPTVPPETGAAAEQRPHATPGLNDAQPLGGDPSASPSNAREPYHPLRSVSTRLRGLRPHGVKIVKQTPAYAHAKPRVTVMLVVLPDRVHEADEALESVAASLYHPFELLILDDSSSHRSTSAVSSFLDDHPSLPAMLLRQPVNRRLAHSRNTLIEYARGECVFILDPEGGVYPSTLERLTTALDTDTQAIFSYPMVAAFDDGQPVELISSLPWEPERLKRGNWIDGMALIRRERLLELGGYSTDPRLVGWEDFALWCKCAEAGGHGVHIPQVLAWHRLATNVATQAKWAAMRELFPQLRRD